MNSQQLEKNSCQIQNRKNHTFGPCISQCHLDAKILEDESYKSLNVSFKQKNDIFIVENWKNYNTDVSNPKYKIKQHKKSKNQCCTTF